MTLAAWRGEPIRGVAFVVGFYALLVGAKVLLALLTGQGRRRLTDPGYRAALRVASGLLVATGVVLVVEFGRSLV